MSGFIEAQVFRISDFLGLRLVDGCETIAFRFRTTDGNEIAIYVPRQAASIVQTHLTKLLIPSASTGFRQKI